MIVPAQSQNLQVKPKWSAPVGVMESVVAYNCRKYGMPRPVLAMPFWEGAGDRVIDLSGHGNHGTLVGQTEWVSDGLDFDGSGDRITGSGSGIGTIGTGNYTVSAWVYKKTSAADTLLSFDNYDPAWSIDSEGHLYLYDGDFKIDSTGIINFNSWQMITFVRSGTGAGELKYYINGEADSAVIHADSLTAVTTFTIASDRVGGSTYDFTGLVNNVSIFNTALSAAQVKFLYDNPYFMYRLPEELYGYTAAAPPTGNPTWYYSMIRRRNQQ